MNYDQLFKITEFLQRGEKVYVTFLQGDNRKTVELLHVFPIVDGGTLFGDGPGTIEFAARTREYGYIRLDNHETEFTIRI